MNELTDAALIEALTTGGQIAIPYFGREMIQVHHEDVPIEEALPVFRRFLGLSAENHRSDARHLVAYCKLTDKAVHGGILADMGGAIPTEDEIWNHARIKYIFLSDGVPGSGEAENKVYVQATGSVAWEHEHGLQMSWENGQRLVKVGPRDGSPTNYYPPGKEPGQEHVFHCNIPSLCTLPDPEQSH